MEAVTTHEPPGGHPVPRGEAEGGELDRIEAELAEVGTAMARLDDASYGTCTICGTVLADEVLAADPTARTCPGHR